MTYKTHTKFAITVTAASLITVPHINPNNALDMLGMFVVAVLTSLVPDLDHPNSFLSKKLLSPILLSILIIMFIIRYKSYGLIFILVWLILTYISKHRSFSHSLIGMLIFSLPFIYSCYFYPVIMGYASHLFLDCCTNRGISLLYPMKTKFRIFNITTNSKSEFIIGLVLVLLNIIMLLVLLYNLIYV